MKQDDFLGKATDPKLYDHLNWGNTMSDNSNWHKFLVRSIEPLIPSLQNKEVLDIGSGTGSMYPFFILKGAKSVIGVEPSEQQIKFSSQNHPKFLVKQSTFENYNTSTKFDIIFSLFVSEHILDIEKFFKKAHDLLTDRGSLFFTITDASYEKTPRFNYNIEVHEIEPFLSIVKTNRSAGTMFDIVRPVEYVQKIAEKVGLKIKEHQEIKPDKQYLEDEPRYKELPEKTIAHLIHFTK
ncbi:class I SAM-dependent methyltransferase [Candidatus Nomurabacteria bacterium]|nr:class I SAM-dependent methyltransferase [Candidatus Nomurabacteria bacterium]